MHINKSKNTAFSLAELLVILSVIFIMGAVLIPDLGGHSKCKAVRINCASNLKQLALAFRIWEGDNGDRYPMQVFTNQLGAPLYTAAGESYRYLQVMSNEISNPKVLYCPADKPHTFATNFTTDFNSTRVSYFIGLDAAESAPNSLLAGDSNLTNGTSLNGCVLDAAANQSLAWTKDRHNLSGNVALADGSVQQFSNSALKTHIAKYCNCTNRLLMP